MAANSRWTPSVSPLRTIQFYLLGAAGASRLRDGQLLQVVMTKTGREYPEYSRSS